MRSFLNSSEPTYSSSSSSSSSLTSSSISRLSSTSPATSSAALAVVPTFRVHPSLSRLAILATKSTTIPSSYSSTTYPPKHFRSRFRNYYSNSEPTFSDSDENGDYSDVSDSETIFDDGGGLCIQIEKLGTNSRRIYSRIGIDAPLQAVWNILTDYERLADFIPGLAISQILFKIGNHARLFQHSLLLCLHSQSSNGSH
ncbi:hypothetical protein IC575_027223 [Cucumis melo]